MHFIYFFNKVFSSHPTPTLWFYSFDQTFISLWLSDTVITGPLKSSVLVCMYFNSWTTRITDMWTNDKNSSQLNTFRVVADVLRAFMVHLKHAKYFIKTATCLCPNAKKKKEKKKQEKMKASEMWGCALCLSFISGRWRTTSIHLLPGRMFVNCIRMILAIRKAGLPGPLAAASTALICNVMLVSYHLICQPKWGWLESWAASNKRSPLSSQEALVREIIVMRNLIKNKRSAFFFERASCVLANVCSALIFGFVVL